MEPYPYHQYIRKKFNEFAVVYLPGLREFNREIRAYVNALLNSNGGIVIVGINQDFYVKGIHCPRDIEDNIKLTIDNTMKYFSPKIPPSSYRLDFVPCDTFDKRLGATYPLPDCKVIELHIQAGSEILYMDRTTMKSMVLHNTRPMALLPQQIQALAIAKYKQEVLSADTLWEAITPAVYMNKRESKLKKSASTAMCTQTTPGLAPRPVVNSKTVICTQTTPGLKPAETPKPDTWICTSSVGVCTSNTSTPAAAPPTNAGSDVGVGTPCPTPVAELFRSTETPASTPKTLKTPNSVIVITDSPEVICIEDTPFAADSNGDTVRRVLKSTSKINNTANVEPVVKNPSNLFSGTDSESEGRGRRSKRHAAGHGGKKHGKKQKKSGKRRHRSPASPKRRSTRLQSRHK